MFLYFDLRLCSEKFSIILSFVDIVFHQKQSDHDPSSDGRKKHPYFLRNSAQFVSCHYFFLAWSGPQGQLTNSLDFWLQNLYLNVYLPICPICPKQIIDWPWLLKFENDAILILLVVLLLSYWWQSLHPTLSTHMIRHFFTTFGTQVSLLSPMLPPRLCLINNILTIFAFTPTPFCYVLLCSVMSFNVLLCPMFVLSMSWWHQTGYSPCLFWALRYFCDMPWPSLFRFILWFPVISYFLPFGQCRNG